MANVQIKKKFFEVEIPLIDEKTEILAFNAKDVIGKTMRVDMTRKLKGKSMDLIFKIESIENKLVAHPKSLRLMPYFIQHMLRKNASYVEDSITTNSKEGEIILKPFLITRKRVSRAVRKTLRNSAKNWIIDNVKDRTNLELFETILSGEFQKPLSLKLKKIYPLSLCEIRVLETKKPSKENPKKGE